MKKAVRGEANVQAVAKNHPVRNWLRHFFEMYIAMLIGMFAAGAIFGLAVSFQGLTWEQGRDLYPQIFLLTMALGMTLPMTGWMRFRGHGWRSTLEMSAYMFVPGVVLIICVSAHVLRAGPACGLYCLAMTPLMLIPMLVHRNEYTQHRHRRQMSEHLHYETES